MDPRTARMIMERLNRDAERIAAQFGLRYTSIQAERANVKNRYGVCYSDGSIRIRLWHVVTRRPLKYSSLVSTLCHELAHLRHFNHGPRFRRFYQQILEYAREQGIYRPAPALAVPARATPDRVAAAVAREAAPPRRDPTSVRRRRRPTPSPPTGPTQLTLF